MRKALRRLSALACAAVCLEAATAAHSTAPAVDSVAAFYYPWYGSPERDGSWMHWRTARSAELASGFVPSRGAYSSADPGILAAHMNDLYQAGVDTVIVSWWGVGSPEDERLPLVIRAARERGLAVAVHVEPYPARTPESVESDVRLLQQEGIRDVYVYDSTRDDDAAWAAVNGRLQGVRMFAHTSLAGKARAGGFQGLYTYDVLIHDGRSFRRVCLQARALGLLCAPSVGPGFDARQATGEARIRPRRGGRTYDEMWQAAIRADADIVTITSYNEWHEGTQIEPARDAYDGTYGKSGPAAERAYLVRTAEWASRFRGTLEVSLSK